MGSWASYSDRVNIDKMLGREVAEVKGLEQYSDEVHIIMTNGDVFTFHHIQCCCENVSLEEFIVTGELKGTIHRAYESSEAKESGQYGGTETWTFYRIETMQGSLYMRWVGSSNGYYSEAVDITFKEA